MGQPPVLQAERCPQELHTKEGFYKQEAGGVKKLLAKQKKEVLQAWASSLWGKGKAERSRQADYLTRANWKFSG